MIVIKALKKAALYIRVSTESQAEEGYSIEAQKKLLSAWCISKEIEHFEFYIDPAYSGSNIERPELTRMLEDAKKGLLSHVAVYKLDRLSRSQKDTLYIIEDILNKHEVNFVSLTENMDTSTPIGRAMLGILSAFAQLERETIRIRTRMGMLERVRSGLWPGGGKIPFGYDYDSESGILVPNSDAETVREMYHMFLSGMSPNAITLALGLKYEKLVVQILKRKTNIGIIEYRGTEYKGKHEAIIEPEIFYRTIDEFERRSRGSRYDSVHLLSGLIYCGECGARLRYQKWGKDGYRLICYSHQRSKPYLVHDPDCKFKGVWALDAEKALLDDILSLNIQEEKKKKTQISQSESKKIEKKLKRLYSLYADGNEAIIELIRETEEKLRRTKAKESENEKKRINEKTSEVAFEKIKQVGDLWDTLTPNQRRALIKSVVDKITVFNDKITIHYRFL